MNTHYCTFREAFELWRDAQLNELLCKHGGLDGGPGFLGFGGCKLPAHPEVRYGCEHCPEYCKDFELDSESNLMSIFACLYRNYTESFNARYNIDPQDPNYIDTTKPKIIDDSERWVDAELFKHLDDDSIIPAEVAMPREAISAIIHQSSDS